jgi:hypothetical protein
VLAQHELTAVGLGPRDLDGVHATHPAKTSLRVR